MNRLVAQWRQFRCTIGVHKPEGEQSGYDKGSLARCRTCKRRIWGDGNGGWFDRVVLGRGWRASSTEPIELDDLVPKVNTPTRSQP